MRMEIAMRAVDMALYGAHSPDQGSLVVCVYDTSKRSTNNTYGNVLSPKCSGVEEYFTALIFSLKNHFHIDLITP